MNQKDKKSKAGGVKSILFAICAIGAVILLMMGAQSIHVRMKYNDAEELVAQEQYPEALEAFRVLEHLHYRDTDAYLSYCNARICFEQGDAEKAAEEMIFASFRYADEEKKAQIEAFRKIVKEKISE